MKSLCAVVVCFLLLSCSTLDTFKLRQDAEFRWDQIDARTPKYDIPVSYPSWLAVEDEAPVLDAIDAYWSLMLDTFTAAVMVDVREYTIHIHNNVFAFWVGERDAGCWARGWQAGHHIQMAWACNEDMGGKPDGIASQNPFSALAHEWLHIVFDYEKGWEDPGHWFYVEANPLLEIIAINAPYVHLSEESLRGARAFRYIPATMESPKW